MKLSRWQLIWRNYSGDGPGSPGFRAVCPFGILLRLFFFQLPDRETQVVFPSVRWLPWTEIWAVLPILTCTFPRFRWVPRAAARSRAGVGFANNENRFSRHHDTVSLFQTHLENGLLLLWDLGIRTWPKLWASLSYRPRPSVCFSPLWPLSRRSRLNDCRQRPFWASDK